MRNLGAGSLRMGCLLWRKGCWMGVRGFASDSGLVTVEQRNGLRRILLNDSKSRNSLSTRMMDDLINAIEDGRSSLDLRCIAIGATPGPVFSAGHNLKELTSDCGTEAQKAVFSKCEELMKSVKKSEVPVFAFVNGLAAAAGCQLVAACDFAIATETSKFSTPGANFGIFCTTPGVDVARVVNRSIAAYMVLTGLPLSAQQALNAGLIVRVVPEDQLDAAVDEIYTSIKNKSRSVLKLGKEYFYKQIQLPYDQALRQGGQVMVENLSFEDSQEGLRSFKEKRKPTWSHDSTKLASCD
ncbi:unnamed protein product [Allacma fusca]|uniref:Enoyl-CoA hydratase domain-containing protein 3, mitochondrial n=1 Tax=Allacma fusca TaxID=39272 RepID=A0A8J2KFX5_9HEXA|nr:unnamed protein product [Allacma fusca]